VGAFHSATGAIESVLKDVSPVTHSIARRLATAGGKRIKMRLLGTDVTSRYYVYNETTTRLAPNQHKICRPVKISEVLYSPLPQRTGKPVTARRIQPVAVQVLRDLVAHKLPFSGPTLPHRLRRSLSTSCQPACISNKRGQLRSVTWSYSDIPLVLRDCASTPHWCYVVYTPTGSFL
jgi:hypothetical protein